MAFTFGPEQRHPNKETIAHADPDAEFTVACSCDGFVPARWTYKARRWVFGVCDPQPDALLDLLAEELERTPAREPSELFADACQRWCGADPETLVEMVRHYQEMHS